MKTIQKEIINHETIYEAVDGTTFYDKAECEKYEKSALGLMKSRLTDMAIGPWTTEYSLFETGCDDCQAIVVVPKDKADIDTLRQLILLVEPDRAGSIKDRVPDDFIGKVIIVFFDSCGEYVWFRTLDSIVASIAGDAFHLVPNTDKQ